MFIVDFPSTMSVFYKASPLLAAWSVFQGTGRCPWPSFLHSCLQRTPCVTCPLGSEAKASGNHLPSGKSKFGGGGTRWLKCKLGLPLLIFLAMIAVNHSGGKNSFVRFAWSRACHVRFVHLKLQLVDVMIPILQLESLV